MFLSVNGGAVSSFWSFWFDLSNAMRSCTRQSYLMFAIVLLTGWCFLARMGFISYEIGFETVYVRSRRDLHRIAAQERFSCPNKDQTEMVDTLTLFVYQDGADFDDDLKWHRVDLLDGFSVDVHESSLEFLAKLPLGARSVREAFAFQPNPVSGIVVIPKDCFEALQEYDWYDVRVGMSIPRYRP